MAENCAMHARVFVPQNMAVLYSQIPMIPISGHTKSEIGDHRNAKMAGKPQLSPDKG